MQGKHEHVGPAHVSWEQSGAFPSTRWSLIALAKADRDDAEAAAARREVLGVLLARYTPALRAHLLRKGFRADRVDDLLQEFIAEKVLERDLLSAADAARGRFRGFLVTSLDHFVANQIRHDGTAKRAPAGAKLVALDAEPGWEPAAAAIEGGWDVFDVEWAREAIREALRRMRDECRASGREDLWEIFEARLVRPALEDVDELSYAELVKRYGYATPKQASNALETAKRRYRQCLRSVVGEYTSDEQELEQELKKLADVLEAAAHATPTGDEDDENDGDGDGDDRDGEGARPPAG